MYIFLVFLLIFFYSNFIHGASRTICAVNVRIDFDQQVSYLAVDAIFPEWKIWTQFLDDTASGMKLDALSESHPIEVLLILQFLNNQPIQV